MRKKLPVGIESFEEFLNEGFYYIDKTMFIADLLHNWGKVNLFTRPRRFGKSLNISMLKSFFEIGSDKALFDGLDISREKELCEKYMGAFPVISISLKSVDGLNYQEACAALCFTVGMEALRFRFLADSGRLSAEERKMYLQLIEVGKAGDSVFAMKDAVLLTSLKMLSQLLFQHYGSKVILLIDEYDVPLDKAFQAGYYDKMVSLLRSLFGNVLKANECLYFAVMTGCLRISKESIFTGLNNLNVMTITDAYFNDAFGFTDGDVKKLLADYGLDDALGTMRDWYDGYRFGGLSIYCPWDVIKYAQALLKDKNAEPENYWANTSGNAMVRRFIGKADHQTRSEIERLIAGEWIMKPVNQELTYSEVDSTIDNLWSVLFTTGYLTQKGKEPGGRWKLAIPNKEIRELFIKQIQEWFKEETRADTGKLAEVSRAFLEGNALAAEELLRGYLWKSVSIRDTAVKKEMKENFFHGMLLGLLQYEHDWDIASNAESGEGYSDITIKTQSQVGAVIEIKYADDGNMAAGCERALEQIEEKKHDLALRKDGMEKVLKYGIAFYKKNCKVMLGDRENESRNPCRVYGD